ncbi:hypothetical protein PoB_003643000 [Plakobranchus ocellatus]|uniref:Uncharacterized protein n=1 Tax=Plakobranchus ocellatus TaxID=259542 RepID=A0AAV4ANU7_9GAST|nr:hypothetical protein PoB_003643000 [Plakobranchus ocellatus]
MEWKYGLLYHQPFVPSTERIRIFDRKGWDAAKASATALVSVAAAEETAAAATASVIAAVTPTATAAALEAAAIAATRSATPATDKSRTYLPYCNFHVKRSLLLRQRSERK